MEKEKIQSPNENSLEEDTKKQLSTKEAVLFAAATARKAQLKARADYWRERTLETVSHSIAGE
ncbi:hypothetical protein [Halocynthiibacter sp.]|uniref:hypothetical protein n=1 Tax=Halocynthiibacter sp. TaxID=1979210 RepID=UPI003C4CE7DB